MTNIQIRRLTLKNFKCHKHLTIDLDGRSASIYGDNAAGKTSIYDALTWLLFGKDARGNGENNFEIKPLGSDGEVLDHQAITEVEAVLTVNGIELSLRRTLQEVWSTKRGHTEATYDGNTSEYFIDGVPVKKNAFTERVGDLVDEDTFKMLTGVSYFADGISWKDRRAVLFRVAGVMDDRSIMETSETFEGLAQDMGRLSVEDYKRKLLAEKKKYTGAKTEIPARISECERTIEDVENIDFDGARREVASLTAKLEGYEGELMALDNDVAAAGKKVEIRSARQKLAELESRNLLYRERQEIGAVDVDVLKRELARYNRELDAKERDLRTQKSKISELDYKIAACRDRWMAVNGETFKGGRCPTCGQSLPTEQIQAATEAFEADKRRRHREIEQAATAHKEAKADISERIKMIEDEITMIRTCIEAKENEIKRAEENRPEIVDFDGYADQHKALVDRIAELNGELTDMTMNTAKVRSTLAETISKIKLEITRRNEILSKASLLDYARGRVETLREEAKRTAEILDRIEHQLFLLDEFTRYKTSFVEDSINGLFRIARFRLFREQANGGIEDRCDVVYDGVPYIGLNNGAKINVGIDIINTLSRAFGVRVPLFVDNAESVTRLEESDTQIIRLVVSENDKEVRIEHEN